jgi:excisionase family DNA binding protein
MHFNTLNVKYGGRNAMSIASTGLSHHETRRGVGVRRMPLLRRTYSIDEVAQLLGISRNRAYVAARENSLPVPVIRIGRRMVVSRDALDRLLAGNAEEASCPR